MIVLGLTGSIGMGKTTAAGQLRSLCVPVFDADAEVHRLLGPHGAAVPLVGAAFPETIAGGVVDRPSLGARVFGREKELRKLEAILHPLVGRAERAFLAAARRRGVRVAALDIPLLFETGGDGRVEAVMVVSCPAFLQEQRVMKRPGMTRAKLSDIRLRQIPDAKKRRRADFIVPTGLGRRFALVRVKAALRALRNGSPLKSGRRK